MKTTSLCLLWLSLLLGCDGSAGAPPTSIGTDALKPTATSTVPSSATTPTGASATAAPSSAPMSAGAACATLAGVVGGGDCKPEQPGGLGAAAWERQTFELVEPNGKTCQVLSFRKQADLDATVKAFDSAATLAGPHRYANAARLLFVQCNSGMPRDAGTKLERALGQL